MFCFPFTVTLACQISENEILQKNILRVVSIRHSLAQINNGGPKFIESRNTNQFPTTNGTKVNKTKISVNKSLQCFVSILAVAPVGASGGSDRHTLATDISDGGLSFVHRITNQIPAAQTSDECKTAKSKYQGKQINTILCRQTVYYVLFPFFSCSGWPHNGKLDSPGARLLFRRVPFAGGYHHQYEVVQSPAGDQTVFLIYNQGKLYKKIKCQPNSNNVSLPSYRCDSQPRRHGELDLSNPRRSFQSLK